MKVLNTPEGERLIRAAKRDLDFCEPIGEEEAVRLAESGDILSRNKIIEGHLRLVWYLARKFTKWLSIEELVETGYNALLLSAVNYDAGFGVSFKIYASKCISSQMQTAVVLKRANVIRISAKPLYRYHMVNRLIKNGIGADEHEIELAKEVACAETISLEDIKELNDCRLNPEQALAFKQEGEFARREIDVFSSRAEFLGELNLNVLLRRYGVHDPHSEMPTYQEMAEEYGRSVSRLQQICEVDAWKSIALRPRLSKYTRDWFIENALKYRLGAACAAIFNGKT